MSPIGPHSRRMLNQSTQTSAASLQRLVDLRPREGGAGAVLPKSPLWSPERYDRADSKAAAIVVVLITAGAGYMWFGSLGFFAGALLGIAAAAVVCGLLALLINIRDLLAESLRQRG